MRAIIPLALMLTLISASCENRPGAGNGEPVDPDPIPEELMEECEGWLEQRGAAPADYVSDLFNRHSIVLLGEFHRIRHDQLFIQELLPRLYSEGVRFLGTEFARRSDQRLLDSLVTGAEWDDMLGREVIFRQFVPWGYREYVDILKTAWQINREREEGAGPMRVIALNHTLDFSHYRNTEDWDNPEIWELVRGDQTEEDWAAPVLEAFESGGRILVHCGIRHAFSGYRQPRVSAGEFIEWGAKRMGNYLREAAGSEVATVYLHAPWNRPEGYGAAYTYPADGMIDAFMLFRDAGPEPVGFDTAGSPFDGIPLSNSVFKHGYEQFTISDFCDGWIYFRTFSEYRPVTYINGWINRDNIERARRNAMNPNWRTFTAEQMDRACRSYIQDFERFFGSLK